MKLWKGLNKAALMVAFHTQRLKDSICGEFWQNLNVTAEKISSHVCMRNEKQERQSVSALNYYSQMGIIIKRKITLLFRLQAHMT